jgi:chromosome segregation ATPase
MSIFGKDKKQDERLDDMERHIRRLVEQVGELTVDLGATRTELLRARADISDVDPAWGELDSLLKDSRARLEETSAAADEAWGDAQARSAEALQELQKRLNGVASAASGN